MPPVPQLCISMPSGNSIALLGLGTWQITGHEAREATQCALSAGYRHIDTAAVYDSESEVGHGLRDSGVARDDMGAPRRRGD